MEGTGANLRLPLNPPFFFESAVTYDVTTGAGNAASGFAGLVSGTRADRQRPRLRSRVCVRSSHSSGTPLSSTRSPRRCRRRSATSAITPIIWSRRSKATRRCPASVTRPPGPPRHTRRPLFGAQPLVTTVATTAARGGSRHHSMQASVRQRSLPRRGADGVVHARQHAHQQPRLLRRVRRHRPAGRDERHRRRLLAEHLRPRGGMGPGVSRRASQPGGIGHVAVAVRKRTPHWIRLEQRDRRAARRLAAWRHRQRPHRTCRSP